MQTIAVDIDDVLAANAEGFIKFSNERYGTDLTINDYHDHWSDLWQIDNKETERRVEELNNSGATGNYLHFYDAKAVLHQLKIKYKLVVLTARRRSISTETNIWIKKYFDGIFSEIYFAGIFDEANDNSYYATKTESLKKINAQYFIDDQLKHCISASEAGIKSLLFGNYPWNKSANLPQNVTRVANWVEVKKYFDSF